MKLDLIIPALEIINIPLINKGVLGFTLIGSIIRDVLRSENVHAHKTSQRLLNSTSFIQTNFYTAFCVENLLRGIRKHSQFNKNIIKRFIEIILSPVCKSSRLTYL